MAIALRKTGINVVGDVPWGTHFCHFYETKQDLLDTLVPYFKAGLESKEFCLWVVSDSDLITVEEAREALTRAVPDLDRHLAAGNIEILSGLDWYLEKNVFNLEKVAGAWDAKLKRALTLGYEGMRVSGDTFWLREKDWKDFCAYEKQLNDSITDRHMNVLCTYPLAKSGAAVVLDVVQAHQFAIARRQGVWEVIETPQLIQAKAEIKRLNEALEQRVIERTRELAATNIELRREIAERKHTEALLHAKEQEFRAIVENAPDQIIRYDREFRRTYVNPAVAKAYGLPAEALTGKPIGSVIQDAGLDVKEEELAQVRQRIAAVFDTGQSYEYELTWPMPTGLRFYSVRLFPELDLDGSVVNVLGISRDITDRKQAEDALRRSEDHLRLVIDTIPTMAWTVRPDGAVDFVNQRSLEYSGLSLQEQLEEPTQTIYPEDFPRVVEKWLAEMAAGEPSEDEMRLRRADGEYRWFLVRTAPLHDEHGNLAKWYGVSIDIEDRKQAEERLQQSESQLEEAQHLAHVGSWQWDLRSNAVTWSDELYRIFGLQPGQINVAGDAVSFIHPADRDLVFSTVKSSVESKEPYSFHYRILRPDGDERIVHSRGYVVSDEHGEPIRVFGATQDVTERKQAEEALRETEQKYRDIFENAGEGIFQSTPEGRYISANPALARMYRFASPDELIHSRQDITRQLYVDPTRREEFKHQIEEQGAVSGFEHEVFPKDGSKLWISVNARAVRDEQGTIQYYEGTVRDITERKAAEEKLKATSEQLRALSARLQSAREEEGTRIAREVHDELGSALTSLKWNLEEIHKTFSTTKPPSQLEALRKKTETMMALTDTMISTVKRIASELRPSVLDDLGLLEAIEWQTQQFQARTGIMSNCDCALEDVVLNQEQSTAVFRIFQEALTNILRHAQATKVDVAIKEKAGILVLTIRDNGRGIRDDEKSGSQSLGLLGMRERAHLIGAKIDITGTEGKGTVVTIRVPISD